MNAISGVEGVGGSGDVILCIIGELGFDMMQWGMMVVYVGQGGVGWCQPYGAVRWSGESCLVICLFCRTVVAWQADLLVAGVRT